MSEPKKFDFKERLMDRETKTADDLDQIKTALKTLDEIPGLSAVLCEWQRTISGY